MMKLAAMETELAKLITSIDGIEDANVMITLPKESVFINDSTEEASAAIILHTKYGHEFKENQIDSLYLLVSDRKSTRMNSSHVAISYAVFCLIKQRV